MSNKKWLHIAFWQRSKLVNRIKKKARSLKTDFPETWKGFRERKFNFSWGSLEQQRNCRFADVVKKFHKYCSLCSTGIFVSGKIWQNLWQNGWYRPLYIAQQLAKLQHAVKSFKPILICNMSFRSDEISLIMILPSSLGFRRGGKDIPKC